MDRSAGPHRIMLAGKLVALIGCTIAFFWWLIMTWNAASTARLVFLGFAFLPPVALGALIWVVGWVVDGFMQDRNHLH